MEKDLLDFFKKDVKIGDRFEAISDLQVYGERISFHFENILGT